MKLDSAEFYRFVLVDSSGKVTDSGYETPRRALEAAKATGTTARVVLITGDTESVEILT